jgi:hypothetical protein
VEETNGLLSWLLVDACPHPAASIELRATLDDFRNAAFAFCGLSLTEPGGRGGQLLGSCESLLGQGRQHLRSFEEMTGLVDL